MSKRPDTYQLALLTRTAALGDAESLQELLDERVFDRVRLNEALLSAAEHCSVASAYLICVEALLQAGASVHASMRSGTSFLMVACAQGQIQLVELALERGAKVKDCDKVGRTPLHYAVDTVRGDNGDVVEMLIEHGADVNARDHEGKSALHYAASRGLALSLKVLLRSNVLVGLQDNHHQTALALALACNQILCVDCFRSQPTNSEKEELRRTEEVGEVLVAGPEIGEELETGSGSSQSSGKNAVSDQGTETEGRFEDFLRGLKLKRRELREIVALRRLREEENLLLAQETAYLKKEIDSISGFTASLEQYETAYLSPFPPILALQRSPITFSEADRLPALSNDMSCLLSEVNQWQSSLSPVLNRAIDQWRLFISRILPGTQVKVYGSVAVQLHLPSSSVDLVIIRSSFNSTKTLKRLEQACKLERDMVGAVVDESEVLPCLRVVLICDGVEVRLKVTALDGRYRGLKCTHNMRSLLEEMPLLRPVFVTVKQIYQHSEAWVTGLSPYALFLMVAAHMKREPCDSPAQSLSRLFSYYAFECAYLTPISLDPQPYPTSDYPLLQVPDPVSPQSNVATGTDLVLLTVSAT